MVVCKYRENSRAARRRALDIATGATVSRYIAKILNPVANAELTE
jgi:hypothetical protein